MTMTEEQVLLNLEPNWLDDLVHECEDEEDFRVAIRNAVLAGMEVMRYHIGEEQVIENHCICMEPVTYATLRRGYCSTCTRPITIKVGTHGL